MDVDDLRNKKMMEIHLRYFDNLSALVRMGMVASKRPNEMQAFREMFGYALTGNGDKSSEMMGKLFILFPHQDEVLTLIREEYMRFSKEHDETEKLYPKPGLTLADVLGFNKPPIDPERQN